MKQNLSLVETSDFSELSFSTLGKSSIYLDTQHPQGKQGLDAVDEVEAAVQGKASRQPDKPEPQFPKPIWTVPLNPEFRLGENDKLHLEGTVEPKNDPNLKIEWYFNGKALEHGKYLIPLASLFNFSLLQI